MDTFVFYGFLALMGVFLIVLIVRTNGLLNAEAKLLLQERNKVLSKVPQEFQFDLSIRSGASVNVRSHRQGRKDLVRWAQDISSIEVQDLSIRFPAVTHA